MRRSLCCLFTAVGVTLAPELATAQPTSATLARQLTEALAARQTDAWAARDSADPARVVAALHVPGSQLLVVSAQPSSAASIDYRLANKDHRQAYVELQTAAVARGKFFVQDLGADGIARGRDDGAVDVVYEDVSIRTLLNGDWKGQGLTEAEYMERRAAAETRYAAMLSSLLASLHGESGAPSTAAAEPPNVSLR